MSEEQVQEVSVEQSNVSSETKTEAKPKMTQEERRKMLKQKLRDKIRGKSGSRMGKSHQSSQVHQAAEHIKNMGMTNEQMNAFLSTIIKDPKQRKMNKKRIKKMMGEKSSVSKE